MNMKSWPTNGVMFHDGNCRPDFMGEVFFGREYVPTGEVI
jgi:hypothetical protein